jgi:hypothetical protein
MKVIAPYLYLHGYRIQSRADGQAARQMLDQLAWWTAALKAAREKSSRQAA